MQRPLNNKNILKTLKALNLTPRQFIEKYREITKQHPCPDYMLDILSLPNQKMTKMSHDKFVMVCKKLILEKQRELFKINFDML